MRQAGTRLETPEQLLQRFEWYVKARLYEELPTTRVVQALGTTSYLLHQAVKHHYGGTAAAYIQRARLQEAAKLVRYTDFSMGEISQLLRFGGASYFAQRFREDHGIRPSAYREQYQCSVH